MAKPAAETAPTDKIELYDKLVATNASVERKGATVPYTSVNGNREEEEGLTGGTIWPALCLLCARQVLFPIDGDRRLAVRPGDLEGYDSH